MEGSAHASIVIVASFAAVAPFAARRLVASAVHHTDSSIPARRCVRAAHPPERDASLTARGSALAIIGSGSTRFLGRAQMDRARALGTPRSATACRFTSDDCDRPQQEAFRASGRGLYLPGPPRVGVDADGAGAFL